MFAVGAIWSERLNIWLTRGWIAAAVAVSACLAPIALPILEPTQLQRYMELTGIRPAPIEAAGVGAPLTQSLSDEFGWRELEKKVAAVFHRLSPEEQHAPRSWSRITEQAAAIDVYGREDGLPPALSGHNQYWLWGPRGHDGSLMIHVGGDVERWRRLCGSIEIADMTGSPLRCPMRTTGRSSSAAACGMPLEKAVGEAEALPVRWLPPVIPKPDIDHDKAGEDQRHRKPRLALAGAAGVLALAAAAAGAEGGDVVGRRSVRWRARTSGGVPAPPISA